MFKMTSNILRNLVIRKSTRQYPVEVRATFAGVRGELVNDIEHCIFCGTCEIKCPSRCIQVDQKACIWAYDPFACVYCGVCVGACPAKSLYQKTEYRRPTGERLIIRQQGQPRKKEKAKDQAGRPGAPQDLGDEKADPGGAPAT